MNISKSFQVICYLYSVNLYFHLSSNYVWGRAQRTLQWGHSNANWLPTTLHNFFFHPDLMNKFFLHPSSSGGGREVKQFMNKVAEIGNFQLISLFVSPLKTIFVLGCCRCHKTSKMQVPPSFDIDSVGNGIYSFQKTCSSYLPSPTTTREQAVQANKGKALGWRYRVDLTLCFFTYRVEQIVDYNCSVLAVHSACFRRRTVEIHFVRSLIVLYLQFLFYGDCGGWQRPTSFGIAFIRNALQLIRCLRILITANVERITEKASSDEARRRNDSTRNEFMLNWLA